MKQAFESRLNILLSELLNQIGVVSHSEYLSTGRKDVLVYHQGLAIVLEGSYDKRDAEEDAKRRIEQLSADVAIAVHYPTEFAQTLTERQIKQKLKKAKLPVRVIVPEEISAPLFRILYEKEVIAKPVEDWYPIDLNLLATLIQEIAQFIISEDIVRHAEKDVSELVEEFVGYLCNDKQSEQIAGNLYESLFKLYGFSIGEPAQIKEAIFAQAILAIFLGSVYYESIRYAHKLESLEALRRNNGAQRAVEQASNDILAINYEPIFELVKDMLKAIPPLDRPFNKLVDLAARVASKKTLLRRDLAGKVYHKVVGDWALKKGLATYFTQVPAAYLLLSLAKPELSQIADFACGSGTLLVAAYSAANTQFRRSLLKSGVDKDPNEIEREFHTQFLNSCHAFDVLGYASQITALNLALHSPETPIREFSPIITMPLGYRDEDKIVSLGSLELLRFARIDQVFKRRIIRMGVAKRERDAVETLKNLKPFDLVVMNPPFSRTTGRSGRSAGGLFGFMSDPQVRGTVLNDYTKLRNGIKASMDLTAFDLLKNTNMWELVSDTELRPFREIWQAGEGLLFLYLADAQLSTQGKLCFVLPRGLLTGVSWFLGRALLAQKYHMEYVIVSYEAGSYNFSESTSLSECMIIGKKVDVHLPNERTTFVILLKKPTTSIESIALANAIEANTSSYVTAGQAKAFVVKVVRDQLIENLDNWGRFAFLPSIKLLKDIESILSGKLMLGDKVVKIPLTRLGGILSSIGVDRHRFSDTFEPLDEPIPGSVRMLRGGEEAQRRTIRTSPNAYARPLIERARAVFENVGGTLLVPDRIWISTAHVTSMLSDQKTISNIFYILRLKNETPEKLKSLCLWLNTTWGILTMLASREETRGGFIGLKMSQWKLLPVLDVDKLSEESIKRLADVYDEFDSASFQRIPEQYGTSGNVDELRFKLDQKFLEVVGIKVERTELLTLYTEIAQAVAQWVGA
jgi:hypothetical protein